MSMRRLDYKEIINPFILLPLIILVVYLLDFEGLDVVAYSFIIFLIFSIANNISLVLIKKVKIDFYLFVHMQLFLSLLILLPLFYLINMERPILMCFFMFGLTDFLIQAYYNILPRKSGKKIIKLWKDKLIKSERVFLHPISMQKYIFKDFTLEIIEPDKINPTNPFINHLSRLMSHKFYDIVIKHQYGSEDTIAFQVYLNKNRSKFSDYLDNEDNIDEHYKLKLAKDTKVLHALKKIDKEFYSEIVTAFMWRQKLRIVFKKEFVFTNPLKVYSFLKKVSNF